jgi:hypothetical protein
MIATQEGSLATGGPRRLGTTLRRLRVQAAVDRLPRRAAIVGAEHARG